MACTKSSGKKLFILIHLLIVVLSCSLNSAYGDTSSDQSVAAKLSKIVKNAPWTMGVVVLDSDSGKTVFEHRADQPLKPASVLKIITSVVALELLSPQFRFITYFLGTIGKNGTIPSLLVKGGGDPNFAVEQAWLVARQLRRRGVKAIKELSLDTSLFADARPSEGQRAYQTGSSALSFNFNSITFEVCPGAPKGPARIGVDPFEIPLRFKGSILTKSGGGSQFSIDQLESEVSKGLSYQVRGTIGANAKCDEIYRSIRDPEVFFAQTFARILHDLGISVPQGFVVDFQSARRDLLIGHESFPLSQIVRDLNHFSNNFIAEQLLFAIGQSEDGRWYRERGLERITKFGLSLGIPVGELQLFDASGLSHSNRVSARALSQFLLRARAISSYSAEFVSSLSVGGKSGTLKKRNDLSEPAILRGKTGSIDGVSSLAGYVSASSGRDFIFVVINNGVPNREKALALEDQIISLLSEA